MGSPRQPARSRVPGLRAADGCVRPALPVPGQTQQVQMAAHDAAARAGMAAAAARARPVVLRHAGAVLAMTSAFDTSVPNMARVYNYWLGGKDHFAADWAEAEGWWRSTRRCPCWPGRTGRSGPPRRVWRLLCLRTCL